LVVWVHEIPDLPPVVFNLFVVCFTGVIVLFEEPHAVQLLQHLDSSGKFPDRGPCAQVTAILVTGALSAFAGFYCDGSAVASQCQQHDGHGAQ
jgi:hypothetical protein